MKLHVLQHVPFEGPGSIEAWARERGAELTYTRFFEPDWALPKADEPELLVVMGGPMSVNDGERYPWLGVECRFVAERITRDLPTVGICLGAQLIAAALGCRVYPGPHREIGWHPVEAVPHGGDAFAFPSRFLALHWHGETFDLPPAATWLARTGACPHQAFQVGDHVLALQFHLETTPESLELLVRHSTADLQQPGPYVQRREDILAAPREQFLELNRLMNRVLEYVMR